MAETHTTTKPFRNTPSPVSRPVTPAVIDQKNTVAAPGGAILRTTGICGWRANPPPIAGDRRVLPHH
jgi:hypothetical protein